MAQGPDAVVYVITIDGTLDRGIAPYAERVIDDAGRAGADAVAVELDTRGGELDAALRIQRALLDANIQTIAFINDEALSEGALIAIAAETIYMAPGSVLGAGDNARNSATSAVAKRFRSTAEERGRDPEIAAAMADPRITIDGLSPASSALTLTTEEATVAGYADGIATDLDSLLIQLGFPENARIVETSPTIAEDAVRLLTNPLIAALLFAGGLILIVGDLLSAGISLLSAGGVVLMTIFFWGHFLAGLAGWEGVALVAVGIGLLAIEMMVIPGLGVAGVAGGVSLLTGLYLSLTSGDIVSNFERLDAAGTVALVVILGVAGSFAMLWLLPGSLRFQGMVLSTTVERDERTAMSTDESRSSGQPKPALPENPHDLTAREIEVLRLIAEGRTNQEIADALSISVRTVERHVTNIYNKTGISNRAEATAYAFRQNFA
ncbi:hypothetical protein BH23CHL2_BH23CHL2_03620 [soil metagenome]